MKTSFLLGLLVSASSVVCTGTSQADIIDCCGNHGDRGSNWVPLLVAPGSYSAGGSSVLRMQEAATAWTSIPQSSIQVDLLMDDELTQQTNNVENEIWYVATNTSDALMTTLSRWSISCGTPPNSYACCSGCTAPRLRESDIQIWGQTQGNPITWSTVAPIGQNVPLGANPLKYLIIAFEHEVGHVVGMQHSPHGMMRMGPIYPNGGWFHSGALATSPLVWDRWDAEILWPAASTGSNYYAANAQDGFLSGHTSKPLTYEPLNQLDSYYPRRYPTPLPAPNPSYYVSAGETVLYRPCWGQLGNTSGPATYTARLSTDKTYSVLDPVVDTWSGTLPAYGLGCSERTFVVPAGTTPGLYYILFGNGTTGDNIAILDVRIRVL